MSRKLIVLVAILMSSAIFLFADTPAWAVAFAGAEIIANDETSIDDGNNFNWDFGGKTQFLTYF